MIVYQLEPHIFTADVVKTSSYSPSRTRMQATVTKPHQVYLCSLQIGYAAIYLHLPLPSITCPLTHPINQTTSHHFNRCERHQTFILDHTALGPTFDTNQTTRKPENQKTRKPNYRPCDTAISQLVPVQPFWHSHL